MIEIVENLKNKKIVLLPTDTVPGLCFLPDKNLIEQVEKIKKRAEGKGFVCITNNINTLSKYWKKVNNNALNFLLSEDRPTTVISEVNPDSNLPEKIIVDNFLAIRLITSKNDFLNQILSHVDGLIATTSVNYSGDPFISSWSDAVIWSKNQREIFVPKLKSVKPFSKPSKIIKVIDDSIIVIRD